MHDDPDAPPGDDPPPSGATGRALERLQKLVRRLRGPDGCPWDRRQTLPDLRAYLLEEAHEVAGAIDRGEARELRDELGDLLFQAVFVGEIAAEDGLFRLEDALDAIHDKMVERHPHVFGDEELEDAAAVERAWERRKVDEERRSVLEGIPETLPALAAAYRIGQKAAGVGFDWTEPDDVRRKVLEEIGEIDDSTSAGERRDEVGDLLFAVAQWARHLGLDPEAALAAANLKFRCRFDALERSFADDGRRLTELTTEELEERWQEVKRSLRRAADAGPPPSVGP